MDTYTIAYVVCGVLVLGELFIIIEWLRRKRS